MNIFQKIIHKVIHIFGQNEGRVISWRDDDNIFIGFECSGCGVIDKSTITIFNFKENKNDSSYIETE